MERQRKELTARLKRSCKPAIEYLCKQAGLGESDTLLIVMSYAENQTEGYVADKMSMSVSALQKRKRILLEKIVSYSEFIKMFAGGNDAG